MEKRFKLDYDGQQILQSDFNTLGEYGLMDDRVFAELFRLAPYNGSSVSKGILRATNEPLLQTNGANGQVKIAPFRALVGSRAAAAGGALANYRDIRSGLSIVESDTSLYKVIQLDPSTGGTSSHNRYDLIYAAFSVDANGETTTRRVKDPTTKVVYNLSVVTTLKSSIAIGVVKGTPGTQPSWPALPADTASTYYIPLGYVAIGYSFNSSSTVSERNIVITAPVIQPYLSRMTSPVTSSYVPTGGAIGSFTDGTYEWPSHYLPSDAVGSESIYGYLDFENDDPTYHSHTHGAILDDRDWRGRVARATVTMTPRNADQASTVPMVRSSFGSENYSPAWGSTTSMFQVQTVRETPATWLWYLPSASVSTVSQLSNGCNIGVYVGPDGKLRLHIQYDVGASPQSPRLSIFYWVEFTGRIIKVQ